MTNDNLYIWPLLFKRWIVLSSGRINIYPVDSALVFLILMRWLVIYPMDSAIQRLNNRGLSNRKQSISQLQVQVKGTLLVKSTKFVIS